MSDVGLYLVKLSFTPRGGVLGSGSMTLALTVNASTGALNGQAHGEIMQGTEHPKTFTAAVSGTMHSTGYGNIVKIGSVSGHAAVSVAPPAIGTFIAPFLASFSVDSNWSGNGQFSAGSDNYESDVKQVS
jgi:Domain of unknown function (DUF1842)